MPAREVRDYLALWKLLAFYLGTPTYSLANPELAKIWTQSIMLHGLHCTDTSRLLAQNIILAVSLNSASFGSPEFLTAEARSINGNALCNDLGLMQVGILMRLLVLTQFCVFAMIAYIARCFPRFDKWRISMSKRTMQRVFVDGKFGLGGKHAAFELEHVPDLNTKTIVMGCDPARQSVLIGEGVERRNSIILGLVVVFLGLMGLGSWALLKFCFKIVGHIFAGFKKLTYEV